MQNKLSLYFHCYEARTHWILISEVGPFDQSLSFFLTKNNLQTQAPGTANSIGSGRKIVNRNKCFFTKLILGQEMRDIKELTRGSVPAIAVGIRRVHLRRVRSDASCRKRLRMQPAANSAGARGPSRSRGKRSAGEVERRKIQHGRSHRQCPFTTAVHAFTLRGRARDGAFVYRTSRFLSLRLKNIRGASQFCPRVNFIIIKILQKFKLFSFHFGNV